MSSKFHEESRPSKIRKLDIGKEPEIVVCPGPEETELKVIDLPEETCRGNDNCNDKNQPLLTSLAPTEKLDSEIGISKNQLKKLRKREKWEANREFRTNKRREKHKEKQARKALHRAELEAKVIRGEIVIHPPSSPVDTDEQDDQEHSKNRGPSRPRQVIMPIGLILDTNFDNLMTEKEIISLGAQLTRCYSLNKSAPFRTHLAVSSWGGTLKARFEKVLSNTHLHWKGVVFLEDQDFVYAGKLLNDMMRTTGENKNPTISATSHISTNSGASEATPVKDTVEAVTTKSFESLDFKTEPLSLVVDSETRSQWHDLGEKIFKHESNNDLSQNKCNKLNFISSATTEQTEPKAQIIDGIKSPVKDESVRVESETPSLIYLTSDSPNTLTQLHPNTSYIIGGIVDKNRHKGICYKRACERGIPTAKLPIGEYMRMQSRTVLAVNHVVEIMLKWLETKDWGEAFLQVIPKRKQAVLKGPENKENSSHYTAGNDERATPASPDIVSSNYHTLGE